MERYIKPEIKIVKMNAGSLLDNTSFSFSDPKSDNAYNAGLSKNGSNLWDLDDDELEEENY